MEIKITKTTCKKDKPDYEQLGFGNYFTDHMFIMKYDEGIGWHSPEIKPFEALSLDPAACVFHYGQEMFEGLKAYYTKEGNVNLFRPRMNAQRTNKTNDRICMPQIPEDDFVLAIKILVDIDRDWVPKEEGKSLYIRPFVFATEPTLMVYPSRSYYFMIILSPVASYYQAGLNPTKIYVEDEITRAVVGGTGEAKIGGNYAKSMAGQAKAKKLGYAQTLWLDAKEHRYVEEVGTSNVFFVFEDEVVTPPLNGSILPGITRDSVIHLLKEKGYTVNERQISIDEIIEMNNDKKLLEAFGSGTAAVISPIGSLYYRGEDMIINDFLIGSLTKSVYDTLTGIQRGDIEDPYNWVVTF